MITAPYNFVPLNKDVFFPPWANKVSHDIPFEDAESGEIDITITAKSPIFVRDHENKEEFCQYHDGKNKHYYIPGSSVKGMVRNVLEIMSFSKLNEELFTDNTYAVRDLSSSKNFYMKQMNQIDNTTYCGWLKKVDNGYMIEDCGIPGRISHKEIDKALGIDFSSNFNGENFDASDNVQKTSKYKYSFVGKKINTVSVGDKYFSQTNKKYDKREFYKYDANGSNSGKLVLTGQPTPRENTGKKGDGKGFEFLFFDIQDELNVDKKVFEDFKFAYFDERDTEPKESKDWEYWKKKLYDGDKVPVFFQKNGKKVLHFGLSYLYKLPYEHSVKDGIFKYNSHKDKRLDLTQSIFGTVDKNNKQSLKGRVQFSHFKAIKDINPLPIRSEILGTPRASYYPIYVKQKNTDFKTFMDSDFEIAGRKRYPIHKNIPDEDEIEYNPDSKVSTHFTPLKDGVLFSGKLRYHNLKRCELGALISALTFHNTPDAFHNIGMAKSLGYGKVSIELRGVKNIEKLLKEFEMSITEQIPYWRDAEELKELLSMAVEQNNTKYSKLSYMELPDFASNKTGDSKDYLKKYTDLNSIRSVSVKSLLNDDELEELKVLYEEYLKKEELYKKEQKKKNDHDQMYELVCSTDNIEFVKSFISKYEDYSEHIEDAKKLMQKIIANHEEAEKTKAEIEAKNKWEKVLNVDAKFKKDALNNFIKEYPNTIYTDEAKEKLKEFSTSKVSTGFDLSNFNKFKPLAKNIRKVADNKPLTEEQKNILESKLIEISKTDKVKNYKIDDFASQDLLGKERAESVQSRFYR
jgi:CRISPR-associated protein (TIGR03986 family)